MCVFLLFFFLGALFTLVTRLTVPLERPDPFVPDRVLGILNLARCLGVFFPNPFVSFCVLNLYGFSVRCAYFDRESRAKPDGMLRANVLTSLTMGLLAIWLLVEGLRWRRLYRLECDAHEAKRDALVYSSCADLGTVSARYGGHLYECAEIRNDVELGPMNVSTERWLHEAWWWIKHPYQRITKNPWIMTAVLCVSAFTLIAGTFWMWSTERSERRLWTHHQQQQQRMDDLLSDRLKWRHASMPEMHALGLEGVPNGYGHPPKHDHHYRGSLNMNSSSSSNNNSNTGTHSTKRYGRHRSMIYGKMRRSGVPLFFGQ